MSRHPTPSFVRGPYKKGIERRQQILDGTIRLVGAQGVEGMTMRRLADGLNVSETALRHYFDSRDDLLVAAYEENESRAEAAENTSASPVARLRASVKRNRDFPGLVELYATLTVKAAEPRDGVIRSFIRSRFNRVRGTLASVARAEQNAGLLRDDVDADDLATLLVAVADGLQLQDRANPDTIDADRALALLQSLLRPSP